MGRISTFLLKRALYGVFQLWVVASLTFLMLHSLPGDPFFSEKEISVSVKKKTMEKYNLDKPLYTQYFIYAKGILRGDMGFSMRYRSRKISTIIRESFSYSLDLGVNAILIALIFGFLFGIIAGLEGGGIDKVIILFTTLILSIPILVSAHLFQIVFAVWLRVLPIAQYYSFKHKILPAISLAIVPTSIIIRMVRGEIIEILKQDYIKIAKAKGLPIHRIIINHCIKNAALPVVSYLGRIFASVITGSFIVEKIYAIPGLGYTYVEGIESRDYTMALGVTIFYSSILILSMTLADIILALLDPRVRDAKRSN